MAAILFFYAIYLLIAVGLFPGINNNWVLNEQNIPRLGVKDNELAGGLTSIAIACYFGLTLCGMAARADEYEHSLDEVKTGWPT